MSTPSQNSESTNLRPGALVGAYRVERRLGSGGMADVYYAIHQGLERPAALKILRPSLATDNVHLQRFLQEARAAASLVHPNIVQVYDVGQAGELRYIAQEYIAGSNLRHYLAKPSPGTRGSSAERSRSAPSATAEGETDPQPDRQLEIRETLSILLQILAALNKSASSGIVHRDIKPENIMLTPDGDVKVADFGLARLLLGDDPQLTRAGTTLGTPMYMSPEQIQEGQVDIRSDLYSLGVTLYHMLTGRTPFTGETPLAVAMQHVQAAVPNLSRYRQDVPAPLEQLVTRLLQKSPSDRFASPKEILDYLRQARGADLAEHWPDQTVPLPGAAGAAPLEETLQLQSKLRQRRRAQAHRLLSGAGAAALLLGAFLLGNFFSGSSPQDLLASNAPVPPSIERQSSVEEQYRWALFNSQVNRFDKWKAVERHFPRGASEIHRLYVGLAQLQLARAHQEAGDARSAREELQGILDDRKMQSVVKAHAWLQIASLESEAQADEDFQEAVRQARAIRDSESFSAKDRDQLDSAVRLMPDATQSLWLDADGVR